jgi:hypothetical protein
MKTTGFQGTGILFPGLLSPVLEPCDGVGPQFVSVLDFAHLLPPVCISKISLPFQDVFRWRGLFSSLGEIGRCYKAHLPLYL